MALSLAACSSNNNNSPAASNDATKKENSTTDNAAQPKSNVDETGWDGSKYVEPITLTTVKAIGNNYYYKTGESMENNVLNTYMKDNLGIDVKYDWVVTDTNQAYQTKIRLMLSSGDKMPDVITYRGDMETVNMLIDSGQFTDVGGLIDKYAGDVYKKGMELNPDTLLPVTRDGKVMALPVLDYAYNDDMVLWLRQDWMDKLGLQAPKTLADFENIMDAFVNKDPDGNGKKDTLGLATGLKILT